MEIHLLSRFLSVEQPSTASTTHAAVMGKSSSPATPRWLVVSMVTAEHSLPVGPVAQRWFGTRHSRVPKNYPGLQGLSKAPSTLHFKIVAPHFETYLVL